MKALIISTLILASYLAKGQELKLVTKSSQPNPFTSNREEYYVLKDAKKIKHGPYKKWVNDLLSIEGFYKNDKMDSTWTMHGLASRIIYIGNYENDARVGVWKFYTNGELEQEYDFSRNELISFKPDTKGLSYQIISGKDTTYEVLSRHPMVIGGTFAYAQIVGKNLRYPVSALRGNTTGRIFVSFIIDETGKASDHRVVKKGDKNLDAEAVRVIKLVDTWLPALKGDKPVKIIHTVPITFTNAGNINP